MRPDQVKFANTIWIDYLYERDKFTLSIFRLTIYSAAPWSIGYFISFFSDIQDMYLRTPIFYLGSVGIFVTLIGLAYGNQNQYGIYERLLLCFDITDQSRQQIMLNALARHSDFFRQARSSFLILIAGIIISATSTIWWSEVKVASEFFGTILPRFKIFDTHGWYASQVLFQTFLLKITFLLFISFPLGSSASIMIRFPIFLWQASMLKPIFPPALIKLHFSAATTLYSRVSILWMIGVSLIFYLFGPNLDWISLLLVGFTIILGIVNFIMPQITYVRVVSASEDEYHNWISEYFVRLRTTFGSPLKQNVNTDGEIAEASQIESLIQLMKHDDWVYPIHQTYIVVGVYVISITTSLIGYENILTSISSALR